MIIRSSSSIYILFSNITNLGSSVILKNRSCNSSRSGDGRCCCYHYCKKNDWYFPTFKILHFYSLLSYEELVVRVFFLSSVEREVISFHSSNFCLCHYLKHFTVKYVTIYCIFNLYIINSNCHYPYFSHCDQDILQRLKILLVLFLSCEPCINMTVSLIL